MSTTAQLFRVDAPTIAIAATSAASASVGLPGVGTTLRLVNEGPNNGYVSVGVGQQTATLPGANPSGTSTPVMAGEDLTMEIPNDSRLQISVICRANSSATILAAVSNGA